MKFTEGEKTGGICPKCGKELEFSMGFRDCFSHTTGHYTVDVPLIVCSDDKCEYQEKYEGDRYER